MSKGEVEIMKAAKTTVEHIHKKSVKMFMMELALLTIPIGFGLFVTRKLFSQMADRDGKDQAELEESAKVRLVKKMNSLKRKVPPLNQYEMRIMADITFADELNTTFEHIGGLHAIKEQICETVILPLQSPELFASVSTNPSDSSQRLVSVPRGVLLYGPPGTGKTMMAKAIAKGCDATFINMRLSTLQNKWFGESQKLIRALFSVAHKFAPSIIFIDEIDMFMKSRGGGSDHEASATMKSEFMTLWDGLTTSDSSQVTILGATNRPFDIDKAILRRLPRTFLFDLPNEQERELILQVILRNHRLSQSFDFAKVASQTDNFCGSDLRELCKYAAMIPVREVLAKYKGIILPGKGAKKGGRRNLSVLKRVPSEEKVRELNNKDVDIALDHVKPTGKTSYDYQSNFNHTSGRSNSFRPPNFSSSQHSSSPSFSSSPSSSSVHINEEQIVKELLDRAGKLVSMNPKLASIILAQLGRFSRGGDLSGMHASLAAASQSAQEESVESTD